jgi:uracil phosphoribosyltransferase
MQGVTVVDHPLVQHKLTLMRDKERSTKGFRQLLNEIGMLLCYEVTRDLRTEEIEIETPLDADEGDGARGQEAGAGARSCAPASVSSTACSALVPSARVAHIGLYRDPKTLVAVEYYFKAPEDIGGPPRAGARSDARRRRIQRSRRSTG